MAERTRRPAPRTLVSSPLPALRAPRASLYQARFPALATVLAGGVVLPACHDPVCGATRADELEVHGNGAATAAHAGRPGDAMRELGVALGLVAHGTTTAPPMTTAGAPPPMTTVPPTPPMIPITAGGAAPMVLPQPPAPPTHPIPPQGGVRAVHPPPPPVPHHAPHPPMAVPGGLGRASPVPVATPRAQPTRGDVARVTPLPVAAGRTRRS